ncbi:hypothetical protein DRP43_00745, partial [candidate division TA06 bacterium]
MPLDLSAFGVKKEEELSSKPKKEGLDLSAFGVQELEKKEAPTPEKKPKSLGEFLREKGYRNQGWIDLEKQGKMTPELKKMEEAGFGPPLAENLLEKPPTQPVGFFETLKYVPSAIKEKKEILKFPISSISETFIPTLLTDTLSKKFGLDKMYRKVTEKAQNAVLSLRRKAGIPTPSKEDIEKMREQAYKDIEKEQKSLIEMKEKNPTARAINHFVG